MGNRISILLVDEEKDLIKLLAIVLRQHGFRVKTALSGSEALNLYAREDFDLIITEMNMKGMNGFQFIIKLREIKPEQRIIAISVHPFGCRFWDTRQVSLPFEVDKFGLNDVKCLDKPFKINELLESIEEVVSRNAALKKRLNWCSPEWSKARLLLK
ncbi:response regulator [candidate division WOR-3 bacterium]|nr:response regulator [candidate division WOR-3 bacterium]